ncbi:MAG: hypothetical protein PHU14_09780 [Methylovulum sp.]|nr:hypothetical protein [Methylovulum sp.]
MHNKSTLRVNKILEDNSASIPEEPGVYAFWWVAPKENLIAGNKHIVLKGPNGRPVDVEYKDWWPKELVYPCLYVGKSTNIKKRFKQHIMLGTAHRLHEPSLGNKKAKPHNTTCQLRFGIEHVFPSETNTLDLIKNSIGFSYRTDFVENHIAERFFEEDRLIGIWRPWFNIDSER